jgi:hypothetical protein
VQVLWGIVKGTDKNSVVMEKIAVRFTCSNCAKVKVASIDKQYAGRKVNLVCDSCNTRNLKLIPALDQNNISGRPNPINEKISNLGQRRAAQGGAGPKTDVSDNNCHGGTILNMGAYQSGDTNPNRTFIGKVHTNEQKYVLKVVANNATPETLFELKQPFLTIGRWSANSETDLAIKTQDEYMSRKHAILKKNPNGKYSIVDAKSTNKVYINDKALNSGEEVYLEPGDVIKMGRTFVKYEVI